MSKAAPAAVVFDCDGLLLDTEAAWTRAETTLFERHGRTFTDVHKRELIGSSHVAAAAKLERVLERPGAGLALMAELDSLVMIEALHDVDPRPGAVELVASLRGNGTPIALATNSPRAFCERALHTAGMESTFAVIVAGDEVARPKPAPDIYLQACRLLDAEPADAVALEDSPTGSEAARAAGMTVVGVPYLSEIALPRAHVVADSLADPEVARACGL